MSFPNQADDFFENEGGGPRAASWKARGIGDGFLGEIVDVRVVNHIPFGEKEPQKLDDGSIRKQVNITVQTDLRGWQAVSKPLMQPGPNGTEIPLPPEADDGKRTIYAAQQSNLAGAIASAVRAAGQKGSPKIGGRIGVKLAEQEDRGKGNPLNKYEAKYEAPAIAFDFGGQQAPQAAPAAPAAQQWQQPAAPAPQQAWTPPAQSAPAPAQQAPAGWQQPQATWTQPAAPQAAPAPDAWAPPATEQAKAAAWTPPAADGYGAPPF